VSCVLATKVGYLPSRSAFTDAAALRAQLERSVEALGRPVDVLQIHEADWGVWWRRDGADPFLPPRPEDVTPAAPVAELVADAKATGLVRFVGITGNRAPVLASVLRALGPDLVDAVLVAKQYDLVWRTGRGELRAEVMRHGVFWTVGAPLHQGRLLDLERLALDFEEAGDGDAAAAVRAVAAALRRHGLGSVEAATRFLLADPEVDLVLIGPRSVRELRDLLRHTEPLGRRVADELTALGIDRAPSRGLRFQLPPTTDREE
jgi:aryl-alcohol dehydrogenase-like predicted oxidoreductase